MLNDKCKRQPTTSHQQSKTIITVTKLNRQKFNSWLDSINLLSEISQIEISTAIVDEITEDIFIPYEVYREIYAISPHYLAQSGISESMRDRYLQLRRQLELQYALLLTNENNVLYNKSLAPEIARDLPLLAQDRTTWEDLPCRLPPPVNSQDSVENRVLSQLLAEPNFKIILQQLGNIKTSLDRRNLRLKSGLNNDFITYAQTTISLDGKISNRYASEIIEHPQQQEILKLHQKGVEAGTKQWYKLLRFILAIAQR